MIFFPQKRHRNTECLSANHRFIYDNLDITGRKCFRSIVMGEKVKKSKSKDSSPKRESRRIKLKKDKGQGTDDDESCSKISRDSTRSRRSRDSTTSKRSIKIRKTKSGDIEALIGGRTKILSEKEARKLLASSEHSRGKLRHSKSMDSGSFLETPTRKRESLPAVLSTPQSTLSKKRSKLAALKSEKEAEADLPRRRSYNDLIGASRSKPKAGEKIKFTSEARAERRAERQRVKAASVSNYDDDDDDDYSNVTPPKPLLQVQSSMAISNLEEKVKTLQTENERLQSKLRQEKLESGRIIAQLEKDIEELNVTVDQIMEMDQQNMAIGNKQDLSKVSRMQQELQDANAKNSQLTIELTMIKQMNSEKEEQLKGVDDLQEQLEKLKAKDKEKEETIAHLMEQLTDLKLRESKATKGNANGGGNGKARLLQAVQIVRQKVEERTS